MALFPRTSLRAVQGYLLQSTTTYTPKVDTVRQRIVNNPIIQTIYLRMIKLIGNLFCRKSTQNIYNDLLLACSNLIQSDIISVAYKFINIVFFSFISSMLQRIKQQIKKTSAISISNRGSNIDFANDKDLISLISTQNTIYIVKLQLQSNEIGPLQILRLSLGTWKSLCKIDLLNNRLGNRGCQFITRAELRKLKQISLSRPELKSGQNHIGSQGVLHLSKSNWTYLNTIFLGTNDIGLGGTVWLVRSNWNMKSINLNWNKLKAEDMQGLLLAQWKLAYLTLGTEIVKIAKREKVRKLIQLKNESISLYF